MNDSGKVESAMLENESPSYGLPEHGTSIESYIQPDRNEQFYFSRISQTRPMLSTPCESVQICTDPDRYSRICRKITSEKTIL